MRKRVDLRDLEKVSYEKMCSCRLWKEFVSGDGNILSHRDKFLLATNILYIVGFEKDFLDALKRNYPDSDRNKWRYNLNWIETENINQQVALIVNIVIHVIIEVILSKH